MKTTTNPLALTINFLLPQLIQAQGAIYKRDEIKMRRIILVLASGVGLLIPILATAQGTLQLSNLGQTPTGSIAIGSDFWIAQGFYTGTNPDGYTLNSVQVLMDPGSGSPSGFTVSIYERAVIGNLYSPPVSSLGSLSGSDPSAGGVFNYTASSITLSPSAHYFVVATSTTPVANGAYYWSVTAAPVNYTIPWGLDKIYFRSSNGSVWDYERLINIQFAIYATPVPEPTAFALVGLGLAALSFRRFRQSRSCQSQ
jgi:hypothetical protein